MGMYNFGGGSHYGNLAFNPFNNPLYGNLSDVQREVYQDPNAVYGAFLRNLQGQQAPGKFTSFANQWVRNLYGEYTDAATVLDPNMSFMDYVRGQNNRLAGDYKASVSTRPVVRPTRYLRSS